MVEIFTKTLTFPILFLFFSVHFIPCFGYGIGELWPGPSPTISAGIATTTLSPWYWQYITGGYYQPHETTTPSPFPCNGPNGCGVIDPNPHSDLNTLFPPFPTGFPPFGINTLPPNPGTIPILFPFFPTFTDFPPPVTLGPGPVGPGLIPPPDRTAPSDPTFSNSPTETANLLSSSMADFLTSLTKEQLVAFFRTFFLSQSMGASILDPKIPNTRSLKPMDLQVLDVARSIPAATGKMQAMEQTGLGRMLADFAKKAGSAPRRERSSLIRNYQRSIADLRLPKGIKYALRQIQP